MSLHHGIHFFFFNVQFFFFRIISIKVMFFYLREKSI